MSTMTLIRYLAVVLSACLCLVHVLGNMSLRFRARRNSKLQDYQVDRYIAANGMMMCVVLCTSETSFYCQAASWGHGTCLMTMSRTINEGQVLEKNGNWTTMCRIEYPVFIAWGAEGRYSLTFNEAKTRCQDLGSRVATRQELLDARGMGFQLCQCGWLSDGSMGMVLQERNVNCWSIWNEGIIGLCEINFDKSNVYCIV